MFVDVAKIQITAGDGGDGAVAFHREKYVAAGGPDGGDGGRGGNIIFKADDNLSTLADFRYKRKYKAPKGENGRGARCNGKKAEDLVLKMLIQAELLLIFQMMSLLLLQRVVEVAGEILISQHLQDKLHALQNLVCPERVWRFLLN